MNDFLGKLIEKELGRAPVVQPRLASRYEAPRQAAAVWQGKLPRDSFPEVSPLAEVHSPVAAVPDLPRQAEPVSAKPDKAGESNRLLENQAGNIPTPLPLTPLPDRLGPRSDQPSGQAVGSGPTGDTGPGRSKPAASLQRAPAEPDPAKGAAAVEAGASLDGRTTFLDHQQTKGEPDPVVDLVIINPQAAPPPARQSMPPGWEAETGEAPPSGSTYDNHPGRTELRREPVPDLVIVSPQATPGPAGQPIPPGWRAETAEAPPCGSTSSQQGSEKPEVDPAVPQTAYPGNLKPITRPPVRSNLRPEAGEPAPELCPEPGTIVPAVSPGSGSPMLPSQYRGGRYGPTLPGVTGEPSPAPTIQVTIGRIEVRAITPAPTPAPRAAPATASRHLSLDDYLGQRNKGT